MNQLSEILPALVFPGRIIKFPSSQEKPQNDCVTAPILVYKFFSFFSNLNKMYMICANYVYKASKL